MAEEEKRTEDPLVEISVSGTSFTLRREVLVENDWMLARIVDKKLPWALHHNGRYFIDADPTSFGWVLHFTRYGILPSLITKSVGELETIRSLADFLCFEALVAYLDKEMAACVEVKSEVERLEEEMQALKVAHRKLSDAIDTKDGIKFRCCDTLVLWPASTLEFDRKNVVCPCCKVRKPGKVQYLKGNRGAADTSKIISGW